MAAEAVLQEAVLAQAYEDDGDVAAAIDSYYKAACQLSYFVDLHVEKGTVGHSFCQGLVRVYQQRMEVLRARQDVKGHQWVQLERPAAGDPGALASSAFPGLDTSSISHAQQQQRLCLDHVQQQAVLSAAAAGAGGLQQVFAQEHTSALEGSSSQLDLYNTCQRVVFGSLDDVVGLEDVKQELEEAVFLPLQHPQLFKGIRQPPRTFLLYGPPGTGKTLLVEKVAAEAGFTLLSLSPSMILSKWSGDSEKAISGVFDLAKSLQPCIIFLDEVDSLGQSRGSNTDAGARRLLTELLIQFTRAAGEEGVYVFGATNRIQDCDQALLRRFSRRIEVPLPGSPSREAFFQSMLARPEVESDLNAVDVSTLVELTAGYSGSDLADLCRTAALAPVRELMQQQRQQLGRKRRRTGLGLGLPLGVGQGSRQSEESCAAAGSPADSTACTAGRFEVQQAAGAGSGLLTGQEPASAWPDDTMGGAELQAVQLPGSCQQADAAGVRLRALMLADFKAALELVKPAAVDAGVDVR